MTDIEQLRADRMFGLNGWRNGGSDGSARWSGDDGRALTESDIIWMRLRLADNDLNAEQAEKYQKIVDAEQAEFERLDAIYEAAKGG
jgi:hypothetical protein